MARAPGAARPDRKIHRQRVLGAALVCALSLAATAPLQAQSRKGGGGGSPVTVNFVNADVEAVTRAIGAITNKQFVVDPRVRGTLTVYSETPLTPREAYLNYLAALRGIGAAVVESGGLLKVVPEADAKVQAGTVAVGGGARKGAGDQVVTQIFRLQYENANNLVPVLRPLISPNNTINANPGNNTLVITDYADNLQRMAKIIASMDLPASTELEMVPLKHAIAADIAPLVQKMADAQGATGVPGAPTGGLTGGASTVLADPRTNTLLIKAANPSKLAALRSAITRLDLPGGGGVGGSNIYVVYLKHADAVKMAQVLRAAYPTTGKDGSVTVGAAGGGGMSQQTQTLNANAMGSAGSTGGMSAQATAPVTQSGGPSTGGFIQADPATNSLIITAPEPMYRQLRAVIDQLDSRRAQVYVESLIVEVNADKAADVGIQWQGILGQKGDETLYGGGTNFGSGANNIVNLTAATAGSSGVRTGLGTLLASGASAATGFNFGVLKNIGGTYTVGALAHFLQSNADGNVLSTPTLMTLDNEEAKIVVGQNVPFITGQFTNTGAANGSVNPFQTIERKDVGLTLRIKPQIGENGTVKLTIYQESSSIADNSSSGLITRKRSIESQVVVDDGAMLAIGGLMEDQYSGSNSKVPGLGDVPVVGGLFRSEARSRKKTNLMVFLRPVVVRSADDSNKLSMDRYDMIRATQQKHQPENRLLLPINEAPVLPPTVSPSTAPASSPTRSRELTSQGGYVAPVEIDITR